MPGWMELATRAVTALERIAAALEARAPIGDQDPEPELEVVSGR